MGKRSNIIFRTVRKGSAKRIIPILKGIGKGRSSSQSEIAEEDTKPATVKDYHIGKSASYILAADGSLSEIKIDLDNVSQHLRGVLDKLDTALGHDVPVSVLADYRSQIEEVVSQVKKGCEFDAADKALINGLDQNFTPVQYLEMVGEALSAGNQMGAAIKAGKERLENLIAALQKQMGDAYNKHPLREISNDLALDENTLNLAYTQSQDLMELMDQARKEWQASGIAIGPLQQAQNIDWHKQQIGYDQAMETGSPNQVPNEQWHGQQIQFDEEYE